MRLLTVNLYGMDRLRASMSRTGSRSEQAG